jgi:hypothetical protein
LGKQRLERSEVPRVHLALEQRHASHRGTGSLRRRSHVRTPATALAHLAVESSIEPRVRSSASVSSAKEPGRATASGTRLARSGPPC